MNAPLPSHPLFLLINFFTSSFLLPPQKFGALGQPRPLSSSNTALGTIAVSFTFANIIEQRSAIRILSNSEVRDSKVLFF